MYVSFNINMQKLYNHHICFTFMQVSENGVISFGEKWFFDKPERFPTRNPNIQKRYVVAPFWSDNDIRKSGTVRYVLINRENDEISDQEILLLNETTALVQRTLNRNFRANTMLIVQWDHVHPFPHGRSQEERTLQDDNDNDFLEKVLPLVIDLHDLSYNFMFQIVIIITFLDQHLPGSHHIR